MDLGERIAAWRRVKGLSREDVANGVGVTVAAVYQWEGSGRSHTTPSHDNLEKLVEFMKLTMAEFFGRVPKAKGAA